MKIGVDSCIIIAGVHANHPLHAVAANWLIRNIAENDLLVAHHSILETFAVLTRLPGRLRTSGAEARQLIQTTVKTNMALAPFDETAIWRSLDSLTRQGAVGGGAYDGFILKTLRDAGAEALATFNTRHFAGLAPDFHLIDPST